LDTVLSVLKAPNDLKVDDNYAKYRKNSLTR
jgi:hypothetical protein